MFDLKLLVGVSFCGISIFGIFFNVSTFLWESNEITKQKRDNNELKPRLNWLKFFRPINNWKFAEKIKHKLHIVLENAGISSNTIEAPELLLIKEILPIFNLSLLLYLDISNITILIAVAIGSFFVPDLIVNDKAKNRNKSLLKELPPFLDMLTLTMEAGMDFVSALKLVCKKGSQNILNAEFKLLLDKIRLGTTRTDALRYMANKLKLTSFNNLTSAIIQSEITGAKLSGILKIQAETLNKQRSQRAEKLAHEAPVKILAPLMIFIFPVIFIILLGPILIEYLGK